MKLSISKAKAYMYMYVYSIIYVLLNVDKVKHL